MNTQNYIYYALIFENGNYIKRICWFDSYYHDHAIKRKLFLVADNNNKKFKEPIIFGSAGYGCSSHECIRIVKKLDIQLE